MKANMDKNVWDVVVIGGGIAGLTASLFLAKVGKTVLLLEKAQELGGRAKTSAKNGCYFNLGPHALYVKGRGMQVLQELDIQPLGKKLSTNGWLIDNGKRYTLPLDPMSLLKNKLFSWSAKVELMRFYIGLHKINTAMLQHISFKQWVEEHIKHPQTRSYLYVLARLVTYSHEPDLLSADAALRQLQLGEVMYVDHGWQSFIDMLQNKARQAGIEIESAATVKQIVGQYPEMNIVLSDGKTVQTRNVLSTANPPETMRMISSNELVGKINFLNDMVPVKAACLDIAIDRLIDTKSTYALGLDQPYYFSVHSRTASLSHNVNHQMIHVMKYLSSQDKSDADQNRLELESFMSLLQPGWEKRVIYKRYLPTMTVTHGMPVASYGGISGRPNVIVAAIPGLYIAGDWVGNKGLLADASFSSAKEAADAIISTK